MDIKPIAATCKECGEEFEISVKEQVFAQEGKGYVLPKRCPKCRASRKNAVEHLTCIECGDEFTFTAGEKKFYEEHGYSVPKRCKSCRKLRRDHPHGKGFSEKDK